MGLIRAIFLVADSCDAMRRVGDLLSPAPGQEYS